MVRAYIKALAMGNSIRKGLYMVTQSLFWGPLYRKYLRPLYKKEGHYIVTLGGTITFTIYRGPNKRKYMSKSQGDLDRTYFEG
jgi:hypothetical protein